MLRTLIRTIKKSAHSRTQTQRYSTDTNSHERITCNRPMNFSLADGTCSTFTQVSRGWCWQQQRSHPTLCFATVSHICVVTILSQHHTDAAWYLWFLRVVSAKNTNFPAIRTLSNSLVHMGIHKVFENTHKTNIYQMTVKHQNYEIHILEKK